MLRFLVCVAAFAAAGLGARQVAAEEANEVSAEGVTLEVADWKAVEKLVAQQKGKVVVVDVWSTSCLPCMKEFPHLVELQKQHKDKIACVSVNVDFIGLTKQPTEALQAKVRKFLQSRQARIHNFVSSVPDEKLAEQLDYASIPIVYVYGKDGKVRKRFDNEKARKPEDEFTYKKDVIPLVEQLLEE